MSAPKQSFFDQKTLIAIALTTVVWIGWQMHLQKKYPNQNQKQVETATGDTKTVPTSSADAAATNKDFKPNVKKDELAESSVVPEQTVPVEAEGWSFKISSRGMGIKDFSLKRYTTRTGEPIMIGSDVGGHLPFETEVLGKNSPLSFKIEKVSETHYVGRAQSNGVEITKTLILDEAKYRIDTEVQVSGQSDSFMGLTHIWSIRSCTSKVAAFLVPPLKNKRPML